MQLSAPAERLEVRLKKDRLIPFIRQGGDEELPKDRFPCRACRKAVPMIHRRAYCYSCWDRLPPELKAKIKASARRPPNPVSAAIARNVYAQADHFLKPV